MKEVIINNWEELQEVIFKGVWDDKLMRYRSNFVYRGISDACCGLEPKLNRVCSHNLELERSLIRNFKKYAYAEGGSSKSFWKTISLAQHHGLPTRLLDWSYSPLVAAHFATEDISEYDKDGVIWCINFTKMNEKLPLILKEALKEENSNSFTISMLDEFAKNFDVLKSLSDEPFMLFFEPASIVDRIANQYALFSVVSDTSVNMLDLIPKDEEVCFRIIIPKEVKLEIRDKLDYINISERLIYPGLDGICKWITRRYSNLGPIYNKNHKKED